MRAYSITHYEKRVPIVRDRNDHVLRFDSDNAYPQRIREYIRNSGTAQACVNLLASFIEGEGFADEGYYKSIINYRGQTVDQILRLCAADFAMHSGFVLHVNYNGLFQPDSVHHVPWDYVRWGLPDDWGYIGYAAIFDDWDRKNQTKDGKDRNIDYIDIFNPNPDVIRAQIERDGGIGNYKGQIFYYTGDTQQYPLAPFHSVLEDVQSDAEAKDFRLRNLQNGFMATNIIQTPEFQSDEEREQFQGSLRQFQGAKNASKILHFETSGGVDENTPDFMVKSIQLQNVDKHFEYSERAAKDSIIGAFNQPMQLHPIRISGKLGNSDEIKEAFYFYNEFTKKIRRVFSECFEKVFSGFARDINPSGDYSIIPLAYGSSQLENETIEEEEDGDVLD